MKVDFEVYILKNIPAALDGEHTRLNPLKKEVYVYLFWPLRERNRKKRRILDFLSRIIYPGAV